MATRRFNRFSGLLLLVLTLMISLATLLQTPQVLLANGIPRRWEANQYQPPAGLGAPTRTTGAGTRGGSETSCPIVGKPLTALLPSNSFGVTVAPYPTFFVFMPNLSSQTPTPVEFLLEDAGGNEVYKANFQTNGKSGIIALNLPTQAGLTPLEVGQDYKWSFSIICQAIERSRDISVEGGVRRVEFNSTLSNQIKQASPQKRVELYAEAEIWQDALATMAQLRRNNPSDQAIAQSWSKLMTAAGLGELAQESLLPNSARPLTSSQR
ncbi:MAG: DUF928 domain-containing protein [Coleofasciculaceae cyanobacterium]